MITALTCTGIRSSFVLLLFLRLIPILCLSLQIIEQATISLSLATFCNAVNSHLLLGYDNLAILLLKHAVCRATRTIGAGTGA
jgi:hypothetical protein